MGIATREVRQRAIEAYRSGKGTQQQIADMFGIHLCTFVRWWKQFRHHGQLAPKPRGHNPSALNDKEMQALDGLIQKRPDLTLEQMRDALGKDCSLVAIHYATIRLDWRYKKSRYERVSKTGPM
jgi:transposase